MRKSIFTIAALFCASASFAQNSDYVMNIIQNGEKVYSEKCEDVDSIKPLNGIISIFEGSKVKTFDTFLTKMTFEEIVAANDTVEIIYGEEVKINNPYKETILISVDGNDVNVNCVNQLKDVVYKLSGTSENGCFVIETPRKFTLVLDNLSLKSQGETSPIRSFSSSTMQIVLPDGTSSYLEDSANDTCNATLRSKGQIVFSDEGDGKLTVEAKQKRAIQTGDYLEINGGNIFANSTLGDVVRANDYFEMNGGSLTTTGTGIEVEKGYAHINGGTITCTSNEADINMFKVAMDSAIAASAENGTFTMNGGKLILNVNGDASKGVKTENDIIINGGEIVGVVKGSALEFGEDVSYASLMKADNTLQVLGGKINIELDEFAQGSRGLTSDFGITFDGGANVKIIAGCEFYETNGGKVKEGHGIKTDGDIIFNDCNIEIISTYDENGAFCVTTEGDKIEVNENANVYLYSTSECAAKGVSSTLFIKGGTIIAYASSTLRKATLTKLSIAYSSGYYIGIGYELFTNNISSMNSQKGAFADTSYPINSAFQLKDTNGNSVFTFSGMENGSETAYLQVCAPVLTEGAQLTYNLGGTTSGGSTFHGFSTDANYSGGTDYLFTAPAKTTVKITK